MTKSEQQLLTDGIQAYVEFIEDMFTAAAKDEFSRCEILVILNYCKYGVAEVLAPDS